jgi:hypothetical protein
MSIWIQAKKSTSDNFIDIVSSLNNNMNNKKFCIALLIDYQKAFDTLGHSILRKLSSMGIHGIPLDLLKSYLENRTQSTCYSNHCSSALPI